ncbi:MAG: bacterial transcriptional activator domain-containing protein [Ilumatobacteraceae bacterium]
MAHHKKFVRAVQLDLGPAACQDDGSTDQPPQRTSRAVGGGARWRRWRAPPGVTQACAAMHLAGEPEEAISVLRRVLRAIPLNSAVVECLMRAHIANDDRAGAENLYQEHAGRSS